MKNSPVNIWINNEAFKTIFQTAIEGILISDSKGKVLVVNPMAEQIFGYPAGKMSGKKIEDLMPKSFREKHVKLRENFTANPTPRPMGQGRDLVGLHNNGTEFPVEISLNNFEWENQLLTVAFVNDITARKNTENALRQSEEQLIIYAAELEKKVEARTEELKVIIKQLEKSLEKERELNDLKSKFVTMASHEFRTPLSIIKGSASLIKKYNEQKNADKVDAHAIKISKIVDQLTSILQDFLSLGKLDYELVSMNIKTVSLKQFFDTILDQVSPLLQEGQHINLSLPDEQMQYEVDEKILKIIVTNLLINAIKYSATNATINIKVLQDVANLFIQVTDQGIGIPKEDQKHITDRFFRAQNVTNIQGTGLGLNIVSRYIEMLRGKLSFTSELGIGSVFTVTLPLQK